MDREEWNFSSKITEVLEPASYHDTDLGSLTSIPNANRSYGSM